MMLDLSKVWPEWTAEEKLGEGAYGSVYKCVRRERGITSYCAIKVITVPHDSSELDSLKLEGYTDETSKEYFNDIVDNFANEISVMENLKGFPNIVSVEDFKIIEHADNVGWDIYIRMELLTSFKQYLENNSMTQKEALKLGKDICTALEICEKNGIIHRDIKADNIFIDKSGNFKLGDFGVARQLERTRSTMSRKGTYAYMAPEVAINGKYDKRADIYSLGMVMYKLLNKNRDPFLDTEKQMIRYQERVDSVNRRLNGEALPKPVNADDAVAEIILKACKFNKEERFASATEMKSAIENILAPKKEPETSAEVQAIVRKEIAEEVKPEDIKAEKSETKIITAPSKSSKINKKAVGIIAAAVAVIVIAGVFAFGMINKKENTDSSTTTLPVAQSPDINEEELYKAYLNSEEGEELCYYGSEVSSEDFVVKWTGGEDVHYIDIDNDGVNECFYCLEFSDGYYVFYNVTLLDVKEDKVVNIHTFDNLLASRWSDRFSLTQKNNQYLLSLQMSGGAGAYVSSVSYTYDGNKLVLVNSTYKMLDSDNETLLYYMSNTINLHENEDLVEESMRIEEAVFNENLASLEENVELSYALYGYNNGNLSCDYDFEETLWQVFQNSTFYEENAIQVYNCRDFNNDGEFEMMLYQFNCDEETETAIDGILFYLSKNRILDVAYYVDIKYPIHMSYMVHNTTYCINGKWFYAIDEIFTTRSSTHLFTVVDDKIVQVSVVSDEFIGSLDIIRPYGAAFAFTAYDDAVDGTGHTEKQYYFFWDEENLSLKEYGAIEITQDDFLKCEGATELLDEIKSKGYMIDNILYRSNGIININYVIDGYDLENINLMLESDGSLTVLHDGYSGIDGNNGFGGNYELAACPEIAIYPYKFPL